MVHIQMTVEGFVLSDPYPPNVIIVMPCVNSRCSAQNERKGSGRLYGRAPCRKLDSDLRRSVQIHLLDGFSGFEKIESLNLTAGDSGHAYTHEGIVLCGHFPFFAQVVKVRKACLECTKERGCLTPLIEVILRGDIRDIYLAQVTELEWAQRYLTAGISTPVVIVGEIESGLSGTGGLDLAP